MRLADITYSMHTLMGAKLRTFLTMLGVIIGVMSVVAVSSVGKSAQDLVLGQITALGTNLINVIPGSSPENQPPPSAFGVITTTFTQADYEAIRALPHVLFGSSLVTTPASIDYGKISFSTTVNGTSPEALSLWDAGLDAGRYFNAGDLASYAHVIVLGNKVAADLTPHGGDLLGQTIRVKGASFQVIGILAKKGSTFGQPLDSAVFMPVTSAQKAILGINYVNAAVTTSSTRPRTTSPSAR